MQTFIVILDRYGSRHAARIVDPATALGAAVDLAVDLGFDDDEIVSYGITCAVDAGAARLDASPVDWLGASAVTPRCTPASHEALIADDALWAALPFAGTMDDGCGFADSVIELRHCRCKSTLSRSVIQPSTLEPTS